MSKLLRRRTGTICFFCHSESQPRDPRSFKCSSCGCWNRYDAHGEIVSDDPAMHDETMNTKSFAKRASPRKDRFLSVYTRQGQGIFCHTCQTNQMLISNLLSNYLPSQDDSEYSRLLAQLPSYQSSLETRYPPICQSCLPAVEEEIQRRDHMARTSALGGFLKESRGKDKQRQVAITREKRDLLERRLFVWRIRGLLWIEGVFAAIAGYSSVAAGYLPRLLPTLLVDTLPGLVLLSLAWTVWDPTYASISRAQLQGRQLRQRGKRQYNVLQSMAWLSRFATVSLIVAARHKPTWDWWHLELLHQPSDSVPQWLTPMTISPLARLYIWVSLLLELIAFWSLFRVRTERPPKVQLVPQHSQRPSLSTPSSRQTTPSVESAPPDMLSSLSLSNKPVFSGHVSNGPSLLSGRARSGTPNAVFGRPSLANAASIVANGHADADNLHATSDNPEDFVNDDDMDQVDDEDRERDPNAMDWSPIAPSNTRQTRGRKKGMSAQYDDGSWLRPQRFFAPEEPTGLEGLFEKTITLQDERGHQGEAGAGKSGWLGWMKDRWKTSP